MRVLLLFVFLLIGCDPAVRYARQKYPGCDVDMVDDGTVLVSCPGDEPFEKHYRER